MQTQPTLSKNLPKAYNRNQQLQHRIDKALPYVSLPDQIVEQVLTPRVEATWRFPHCRDSGEVEIVTAHVVQFAPEIGLHKGGTFMQPDTSLEKTRFKAALMTLKNSVSGLPFSGAKHSISINKQDYTKSELERLIRRFTMEIFPMLETDVTAGDVNFSEPEVAIMHDMIRKLSRRFEPWKVTGKPVELGGSLYRRESTGDCAILTAQLASEHFQLPRSSQLTLSIQGAGAVGSEAALSAYRAGHKVVGLSDVSGAVYDGKGLEVDKIVRFIREGYLICDYPEAAEISNADLLELPVDVHISAAIEDVINANNASCVGAKLILEAGNGCVTTEAEQILHARGVHISPDIISSNGGVIASHAEMIQGHTLAFWDYDVVRLHVQSRVQATFNSVAALALRHEIDLRTAAIATAIQNAGKKIVQQGIFP